MTTQSRLASALAAHYEVTKEIGAGGMATVFLARDLKHDRDVAIKVLHPDLGAALGAERFLSEIKTTAKLQHPHILPLIDSGEAATLLYYVMPFVVGESLRQRMDREGQLPINEAIRIAREVAGALDYAHRNGVVHRDIKPENILLNDGQALVADFGIALAVSAAGGARMTQTGLSLGTPQYMSPEQAMGERAIDARSDIYALGAVTYEMLTGEPPFTGPNVQAIVSKIMSQRPTPVSAVRDTVPPPTEEAVMTALCKLPADRFPTAAQFASALTAGSGQLASGTTSSRVGAGRRRIDVIATRFGIPAIPIAIIAMSFAAWLALKRPQPERPVRRYVVALDSAQDLSRALSLAISPDGSLIAFTGGSRGQIFLLRRSEFAARELGGTAGAIGPTFSPDGKKLAFTTSAFELKTLSLSSGTITTISDSAARDQVAWGPDGYIYTGFRLGLGPIFRVRDRLESPPEQVTVVDSVGEGYHRGQIVLPGGKGLVFSVYGLLKGRPRLSVAAAKIGSKKHRILFDGFDPLYSPSGHLIYGAPNGAMMAIRFDHKTLETSGEPVVISESSDSSAFNRSNTVVAEDGTLVFTRWAGIVGEELVWVSRDGKRQRIDSTWTGDIKYPAISPDGGRVAFGSSEGAGISVWIKQLSRGSARKLSEGGLNSDYVAWTPDGKAVSYYSNASANRSARSLWRRNADGSDSAVEMPIAGQPVESSWSPDGRWLAYRTSAAGSGKGDIFAIRPGVDSVPVKIAVSAASEMQPAISPNGRWVAYASTESGKYDVYVAPFPNTGGVKWTVSTQGGSEPAWSRDGRELFYRDGKGSMVAVAVGPGSSFVAGATTELFPALEYRAELGHRNYDVARDGRFLMVGSKGSATNRKLYVIDNWFQELNKKFK